MICSTALVEFNFNTLWYYFLFKLQDLKAYLLWNKQVSFVYGSHRRHKVYNTILLKPAKQMFLSLDQFAKKPN